MILGKRQPYLMENNEKILAVIPARGGSKGLPGKNIMEADGKPLLAYTIMAAQAARSIDRVILSSDDQEIIETAKRWSCDVPFQRPPALASDVASSFEVVRHAVTEVSGYDYVMLLQPTSPLREAADIDAAVDLMRASGAPSCASVCRVTQLPYLMYALSDDGRLESLFPGHKTSARRQDQPPIYRLNGAIYLVRIDRLLETEQFVDELTIAYEMPEHRSIDIDEAADFEKFRAIIERART